jgi:AAA15 family ATPase/GTPase
MLTRFCVKGFRAFSGELDFRLDSTGNYDFSKDCVTDGIVSRGLIYGKNGSGKSSLGFALFDIVSHLSQGKLLDGKMVNGPYLNLDTNFLAEFQYTFQFGKDHVDYLYGKTSPSELVYEKLLINGKESLFIDYRHPEEKRVSLEGIETLNLAGFVNNHVSLVRYIYANSLSNANPIVTALVSFADHMLWFRSLSNGNQCTGLIGNGSTLDSLVIQAGKTKDFEAFLNSNNIRVSLSEEMLLGKPTIMANFQKGSVPLYLIASSGTVSLWLSYCWSLRLSEVSFLFIDEFDAFYHFESAAAVFESIKASKCKQAFLTTHDTSLMNNQETRPDCCFLLADGKIKSLKECTGKELREGHNLEKIYRNGGFSSDNE